MGTYLGIAKKGRRVRRFWEAVASIFTSVFLGGFSSGPDMSQYDQAINVLKNGQTEIMNQIQQQRTMFIADSEIKQIQIDFLKKTQGEIQNKILSLETIQKEDAEQKTKAIQNLNLMLSETNRRLAEQEKAHKELEKNVELIKQKVTSLEKNLNNLSEIVSEQGNAINLTNLNVQINSLTLDFIFMLDQFESEQTKLFHVVKRAKRGELDPYVLSPLNLIRMMQNIPDMEEYEKFPIRPVIENAHKLYNLIKPEVYFHNYTLVFILNMPLVNYKAFEFYKITSFPDHVSGDRFAFILPREPFLLIDKNHHEYLMMPFQDSQDFCQKLGDNVFLCEQTQPLRLVYTDPICEVSLLISSKNFPSNCEKRALTLKHIVFFQLQKPKSWIYCSPSPSQLSISCDNNRKSFELEKNGFITISDKCKLRYEQLAINSLNTFTKTVEFNVTPTLKLSNFISSSDMRNLPSQSKQDVTLILPFELKDLKDMSTLIETRIDYNNYYFLLLLPLVLAVLILSFLSYKKKIDLKKLLHNCRRHENNQDITRNEIGETHAPEGKDHIHLKIPKCNEISRVSVREIPSEKDLSCQYLQIRVKVNKEDEKTQMEKGLKKLDQKEESENFLEDDIYGNSDVVRQEKLLGHLRKLKPGNKK